MTILELEIEKLERLLYPFKKQHFPKSVHVHPHKKLLFEKFRRHNPKLWPELCCNFPRRTKSAHSLQHIRQIGKICTPRWHLAKKISFMRKYFYYNM